MSRMLGCAGLVLIAATAGADARVTTIEIAKRVGIPQQKASQMAGEGIKPSAKHYAKALSNGR